MSSLLSLGAEASLYLARNKKALAEVANSRELEFLEFWAVHSFIVFTWFFLFCWVGCFTV